jgi:hypothetical protein
VRKLRLLFLDSGYEPETVLTKAVAALRLNAIRTVFRRAFFRGFLLQTSDNDA